MLLTTLRWARLQTLGSRWRAAGTAGSAAPLVLRRTYPQPDEPVAVVLSAFIGVDAESDGATSRFVGDGRFAQNHAVYAARHGYAYADADQCWERHARRAGNFSVPPMPLDFIVPPAWAKIYKLLQCMDAYPSATLLLWIDGDALFAAPVRHRLHSLSRSPQLSLSRTLPLLSYFRGRS